MNILFSYIMQSNSYNWLTVFNLRSISWVKMTQLILLSKLLSVHWTGTQRWNFFQIIYKLLLYDLQS